MGVPILTTVRKASFLLPAFVLAASLRAEPIAVVVHEKSAFFRLTDSTGTRRAAVRDVYTGRAAFWGDRRVKPVHAKDEALQGRFVKGLCGMSPQEYKRYWVRKVFSEGGGAPQVLPDAGAVLIFVRDNPDAVGYAPLSEARRVPGVKIVDTFPETP